MTLPPTGVNVLKQGNKLVFLRTALCKNPVHNNPERKNTKTRQNHEHIHKSCIPTGAEKALFSPLLT